MGRHAFDPNRQWAFVNTSRALHEIRLIDPDTIEETRRENPDLELGPQIGTPYAVTRDLVLSPFGLPCNPPPWGMLHAIDLSSGQVVWETVLGTTRDLAPFGLAFPWGTPNFGGPMVTGGGVLFIGAALDNYLRAFDVSTGQELWKGRLPAGGQATPMTYEWQGRQYVVIAAGGHERAGTKLGDAVVAYALPE